MFIVFLVAFFLAAFSIMALVMYLDAQTLTARPPKLTIAEGSAEASSEQASVAHDEDAKSGRMRVEAVLNGAGRGQASSTLGHEFQVRSKKTGRFYVVIEYEYRAGVRVADGAGKSSAVLDLHIGDKSARISETLQDGLGDQRVPEQGEVLKASKKILTILKPGPTRVWVGLSAVAEQTGDASANCRAEADAKVTAISVKPTLGSLFA
ncbi:MAG: hypothetical protein M3461_19445 [Pseudomonadota bacterium]|nr:hypothetical protein [Pseudomonadota bacterium]